MKACPCCSSPFDIYYTPTCHLLLDTTKDRILHTAHCRQSQQSSPNSLVLHTGYGGLPREIVVVRYLILLEVDDDLAASIPSKSQIHATTNRRTKLRQVKTYKEHNNIN